MSVVVSEKLRKEILNFLQGQRSNELLATYLFFVGKKYDLRPVAFTRDKIIYKSAEDAAAHLEKEGKLWRETEIKIGFGPPSVNEQTKRIYICPFTGKVFGDNTHPNPQDAIYDWVAKCPENTEKVGGLKVKKFFISDDPEVIRNYIKPYKEPITKVVFSSALTGKLFNSKESVIEDFKEHYLKPMTLAEVQNQSRYQLEEGFLTLIQGQLQEEKVSAFVEAVAEYDEFLPFVAKWVETDE